MSCSILRMPCRVVSSGGMDELRTRAEFVEITTAGIRESHVHDVQITKEALAEAVDQFATRPVTIAVCWVGSIKSPILAIVPGSSAGSCRVQRRCWGVSA